MKQNVVMKQRAIKRVLAMVAAMLFAIGGASAQLHSLGLSAAEAAGALSGADSVAGRASSSNAWKP